MFDFQKLVVYQKAKAFHLEIWNLIETKKLSKTAKDQLERASFSIALNIAEGTGRFSKADRRNFYIIARSSALECAAILDLVTDKGILDESNKEELFLKIDELSKILFVMIQRLG